MSRKPFLVLLVSLCVFVPVWAQTKPGTDDDVVRITTNLVQVDAVVTRNGKLVKDLKAEDFEIFEDGRRQEIISFAYVSTVGGDIAATRKTSSTDLNSSTVPNSASDPASTPAAESGRRRIAFVVDDYGLSAQSMIEVKRQMRKFIDEQLKPDDLVAIVRTSHARREPTQLTNDKSKINQAWEQVKWNQCSRVGVKPMPRIGDQTIAGCGSNTASFDDSISSLRAVVAALGRLPGRKSMIVFSNDMPLREDEKFMRGGSVLQGDADSRSEDAYSYTGRLRHLAELAIRTSVVIYGIDAGGLQVTGFTAADATPRPMMAGSSGNGLFTQQLRNQSKLINSRRDGADKIAKATGGFLIHDQNEFQIDKILEDQSGYYLIGYRPSTETFDKRFHKISARVKKSGHEVRTRSGFFGLSEEDAKRSRE